MRDLAEKFGETLKELRHPRLKIMPEKWEWIPIGEYVLGDNTELSAAICNTIADEQNLLDELWTYREFKAVQNTSPEPPEEADPHDPQYWPSQKTAYPPELIERHGLEYVRQVHRAKNIKQAQNAKTERHESRKKLFLQARRIGAAHHYSNRSYLEFCLSALQDRAPDLQRFFFTPRPLFINEHARRMHTFISGGTGSGKSETVKTLLRHYLTTDTDGANIILDPHGDLAETIAKMEEFADSEDLIYIKSGLFKGREIRFNPFDFTFTDEKILNKAQKSFIGAVESITGHKLTPNQRAIVAPAIGVLLQREGSTFEDLVRFMDDERNRDLIQYGKTKLLNRVDRDFFQHKWHTSHYDPSKEALSLRFHELIRDPNIREFFGGTSSFNLREAIESGKTIVFSFNQDVHTEDSIKVIGQMFVAYLTSYAMQRKTYSGKKIHLFADECQYFVNPILLTILKEARKYQLYLTIATQDNVQLGKDLAEAVYTNLNCFLVGQNGGQTAEKQSKELGIPADEIRNLPSLNFFYFERKSKAKNKAALQTTIDYVGNKYAMSGEQWKTVLQQQMEKYYPLDAPVPEYDKSPTPEQVAHHANEIRTHQPGRKPMWGLPNIAKIENNNDE